VKEVVVNVHHFADRLEAYLGTVAAPAIAISDERSELFDTGGGIARALPRLGTAPFFVVNSDSLWFDGPCPALARMRAAWDDRRMDCLLLIAPVLGAVGYDGAGDFLLDRAGRLVRPTPGCAAPYVHTGCYLVHPRLFGAAPAGRFSMNLLWDRAIAEGRLFGLAHDGLWLHVGTPKGLAEAEAALAAG
jgi:N-acetyl-alpha-D-muramate 1-phosphate uridylyltransferase